MSTGIAIWDLQFVIQNPRNEHCLLTEKIPDLQLHTFLHTGTPTSSDYTSTRNAALYN